MRDYKAFNLLPMPLLILEGKGETIHFVNAEAEQLFATSAAMMQGSPLRHYIAPESALFDLIARARAMQRSVTDYALTLELPRLGAHLVNAQVCPVAEGPEQSLMLIFTVQSQARTLGNQLVQQRNSTRALAAMAGMLAHEIRNPLSGIKGAAQLLALSAQNPDDHALTQMIELEVQRIAKLVDNVENMGLSVPLNLEPVNVHAVLQHVVLLARAGFASEIDIEQVYDPSIPMARAQEDALIEVLLNVLKNAAEAIETGKRGNLKAGRIVVSTAYEPGLRLVPVGAEGEALKLPLVISIDDNGGGIAEDMQASLFDPFVTSKPEGKGLGLSLVARRMQDMGGSVDFQVLEQGTRFRLLLAVAAAEGRE